MLIVLRIIFFVGVFVGLPVILGKMIFFNGKGDEEGVLNYFVTGLIFMFAIGYLECIIAICAKIRLSTFTYIIYVEAFLIVVVLFLFKRVVLIHLVREIVWCFHKLNWCTLLSVVFVMIIAVVTSLFGSVSYTSEVVEIALGSYRSDTLFEFNPYTDEAYQMLPIERIKTPYAMLYSVSARMLGQNPIFVIQYIWTGIWILLSFAAIILLTTKLFGYNKKTVSVFVVLYFVMNATGFAGEQSQPQLLLINTYDGFSVLVNFVFPIMWYNSLCLLEVVHENGFQYRQLRKYIGIIVCCGLVSKSLSQFGIVFFGLIITIFGAIYLLGRLKVYDSRSKGN